MIINLSKAEYEQITCDIECVISEMESLSRDVEWYASEMPERLEQWLVFLAQAKENQE